MADESSTQNPNGIGYLAHSLTITSASIITDTQNGVLELKAPTGATGTCHGHGDRQRRHQYADVTQSFNVTIAGRFASNPANPFASVDSGRANRLDLFASRAGAAAITNLNNSTPGKALQFQVTGVTSGNTVEILADGNVIGR